MSSVFRSISFSLLGLVVCGCSAGSGAPGVNDDAGHDEGESEGDGDRAGDGDTEEEPEMDGGRDASHEADASDEPDSSSDDKALAWEDCAVDGPSWRCFAGDCAVYAPGMGIHYDCGEGGQFGRGFYDGANDRVIVPLQYFVMAVDLATGKRSLISGTYVDEVTQEDVTRGTGPELGFAKVVRELPNHDLLINHQDGLIRIDIGTGNRTKLLVDGSIADAGNGFYECGSFKHEFDLRANNGFTVSASGDIFIPITSATVNVGHGIVKYSGPNFDCSVVTLSGASVDGVPDVGSGPNTSWIMSMATDGTTIWAAQNDGLTLFSIDVATGKRTASPYSNPAVYQRIEDLALGEGVLWAVTDRQVTSIKLSDKSRSLLPLGAGPLSKGNFYGVNSVIVIPNSTHLVIPISRVLIDLDTATGQSNRLTF